MAPKGTHSPVKPRRGSPLGPLGSWPVERTSDEMVDDSREEVVIRSATPEDAAAVAGIYNPYVTDTIVTFEEEAVSTAEMARRMKEVQAGAFPWLVAERADEVIGYSYAAPWKPRSGYRFSAEITVYLAPGQGRRGTGAKLYGALFPMLRQRGIRTLIGGIALPNEASVALHEKLGMEKVAHFREVGFKLGQWIDVGYWQRAL